MPTTPTDHDLDVVRTATQALRDAELARVMAVLDWCAAHEVDTSESATYDHFGDGMLRLAGEGAPCVGEFRLYELAAVLGMSSDSGKLYVGKALELRYRLPRVWGRVLAGEVALYRALRLAEMTMSLPAEGARQVDHDTAFVAHDCTWAQFDRAIEAALTRFDPATAEAKRAARAEQRRVDIGLRDHQVHGTTGVVLVEATLDVADALDLEAAVARGATALLAGGSTESLDVRRSQALGEMARRDLTLDLEASVSGTGRGVTLYAHLGTGDDHLDPVGTLDNTRGHVLIDQIRSWCQTAGTSVKVYPLIDLNEVITTDTYRPSPRLERQVKLRDKTCVFPRCGKAATACDLDHRIPHPQGTTANDNLAPLCRRHHRAKTFGRWRYDLISPGIYEWTSPSGLTFTTTPR